MRSRYGNPAGADCGVSFERDAQKGEIKEEERNKREKGEDTDKRWNWERASATSIKARKNNTGTHR